MAGDHYLGRAGALVKLPVPLPGWEATDTVRGGVHELAGGGNVRDRTEARRRWVLTWRALDPTDWSTLRTLLRVPGPYRLLDPSEPNRLTGNQATGTDELRDATGWRAVGQGTVATSTEQASSGLRSLAWNSTTTLDATGRGVALSTSTSVDATWAAVRPSVAHSFQVQARCTLAVTIQPRIDWYTSAGALLSSDTGTAVALSTSGWTQLVCANKTSPATAAYAVCGALNTTTTGAATVVYFDAAQLEEGAAATSWRLGAGTPLVWVDSLTNQVPLADPASGFGLHDAELVLIEL